MTNNRTPITIPPTPGDKLFDNIAWVLLVILWVASIYNVFTLPQIIPIHFNGSGEADRFGDKTTLLLLPVLGSVILLGLTKINHYPQIFNFPVTVTSDNASRQYPLAQRMIRFLKLSIVLIFLLINLFTTLTVKGMAQGLASWLLPVILVLVFIPTLWFTIKSLQLK